MFSAQTDVTPQRNGTACEPTFESILGEGAAAHAPQPPEFFHDLGLDQIVQAVVSPWPEYDLSGFFHANLVSEDAVRYRQEVLRDLEQPRSWKRCGALPCNCVRCAGSFNSRPNVMTRTSAIAGTSALRCAMAAPFAPSMRSWTR